jgi:hypothetical protein
MHTAWQDLRYVVRMLLKNSGLNLAAIATLALGMGATAYVFSILEAVLIKPLPYHEPERPVWLANSMNSSRRLVRLLTSLNVGDSQVLASEAQFGADYSCRSATTGWI